MEAARSEPGPAPCSAQASSRSQALEMRLPKHIPEVCFTSPTSYN